MRGSTRQFPRAAEEVRSWPRCFTFIGSRRRPHASRLCRLRRQLHAKMPSNALFLSHPPPLSCDHAANATVVHLALLQEAITEAGHSTNVVRLAVDAGASDLFRRTRRGGNDLDQFLRKSKRNSGTGGWVKMTE